MIDGYGRNIDYIRISLTDRCNLRCVYCMPAEGVVPVSHNDILTFDEITRLCRIFASLGIGKIKLTGGEPLCRRNVAELIRELHAIPGVEQVTMTSNAVLLGDMWDDLCDAGLDAMNISLDTMDEKLFEKLTRRDMLDTVLKNTIAAAESGRIPLKINCVPMSPAQKLYDVAVLARDYPIHVRYIEMMPIGNGRDFAFYSREETINRLEAMYGPVKPVDVHLGNGPAEYYEIEGFRGKIGFISAVSHKFCYKCNRIRLTATGFLKTCLQYDEGVELRPLLRGSCSDEELTEVIRQTILHKPVSHHFEDAETEGDEQKGMSQIGG